MTSSVLAQVVNQNTDNPVFVYLASLAPGPSRLTQARTLQKLARDLKPGATLANFRWWELGYGALVALREAIAASYAPNTANRVLSAVRCVLREAWRLGKLSAEDFARFSDLRAVKGQRLPRGRSLEQGELAKLMEATKGSHTRFLRLRDAAWIAILYGGGLRRAELVALRLDDVGGDEDGRISLRVLGKGNKERLVWLTAELRPAIEAWIEERGRWRGPLFPRERGKRRAVQAETVRVRLLALTERAGVAHCTPHDFRRTFISTMLDQGVDIATVADQVGHGDVAQTARYDRRPERRKAAAADKLPIPFAGRR